MAKPTWEIHFKTGQPIMFEQKNSMDRYILRITDVNIFLNIDENQPWNPIASFYTRRLRPTEIGLFEVESNKHM